LKVPSGTFVVLLRRRKTSPQTPRDLPAPSAATPCRYAAAKAARMAFCCGAARLLAKHAVIYRRCQQERHVIMLP
jgi:hypothetical protein